MYETASFDDFDRPINADKSNSFEALQRSFEAFKEANDARIKLIEKGQTPDRLDLDKITRIEKDLNHLSAIVQRPNYQGAEIPSVQDNEVKAAFIDYLRGGDANGLRQLETHALASRVDADGGYLVPDEIEMGVSLALKARSPMRQLATVQTITAGNKLNVVKQKTAFTAQWAAETASRSATDTGALAQFDIAVGDLYAQPMCSANFLEDAGINVEQWIRDSLVDAFAITEDQAFINGDGSNKPNGILNGTKAKSPSDPKTATQFIVSGNSTGLPTANVSDFLLDLVYGLKGAYRSNASWLMNASTINVLRKEKDANGDYIWQPAQAENTAPMLLGAPVYETAHMPDIARNAYPIVFGDIRTAYLIVDRHGLSILRDPFTNKPYVGFYALKRVGGAVVTPEAIRLVKISAS